MMFIFTVFVDYESDITDIAWRNKRVLDNTLWRGIETTKAIPLWPISRGGWQWADGVSTETGTASKRG